jgi:hypothetical protein
VQVARRILQQRLGADDQKRLIDEAVQEIGKVAEAKS